MEFEETSSVQTCPEVIIILQRLRDDYIQHIKLTEIKNNLEKYLVQIECEIRTAIDHENASDNDLFCMCNEETEILEQINELTTQIEFIECECRKLENEYRCYTEDFESLE